jgi:hypothetical protein
VRGPVSAALEQEILNEIRRQGIVVWLDKDAAYTRFVDDLAARHAAGDLPFPVAAFRGSFLELLFALEPYGSGSAQVGSRGRWTPERAATPRAPPDRRRRPRRRSR